MNNELTEQQLKERQNMSLENKIKWSIKTIDNFYNITNGKCYISTSGADSSVLDWLASQSINGDFIERITVAGSEPKENQVLLINRGIEW